MHSHTGLPSKSNSASVSGVSGTPNSSPAAAASHPGLLPPSTQPHFDSQKVRKTGSNVKQGSRSRQRGSHNARISSPTPRSAPTVIPSKESAISKIARSIFPTSAPPSSSSNRASGNERSPNSSQLHSAPGQQHHHVAAPIAKRSSKSATNVRKVASSSRNK
uniref:WH2 domain-containing protein n=1 Tax=Panagrellus redivivus TaxID=6233 RepID=A0A7E4URS7_PANRE